MDPPQIKQKSGNYILVINHTGKLCQLFIPFRAKCIMSVGYLKSLTFVSVEQVVPHSDYLIIYRVVDKWYPYYCFIIVAG